MDGGGDNGGGSARSQRVGQGDILRGSLRLRTSAGTSAGTGAERHRHRSHDRRRRRRGHRNRRGSLFRRRDNQDRGGDDGSGIVATGLQLVATSVKVGVAGIAEGRQSSEKDNSGLAEELHVDGCAEQTVNVVLANEDLSSTRRG